MENVTFQSYVLAIGNCAITFTLSNLKSKVIGECLGKKTKVSEMFDIDYDVKSIVTISH